MTVCGMNCNEYYYYIMAIQYYTLGNNWIHLRPGLWY
jgi:hypothetical protein